MTPAYCWVALVVVLLWSRRRRRGPPAPLVPVVVFVGGPLDGARWLPADDPVDGLRFAVRGRRSVWEYEYDRECRRLDVALVHTLEAGRRLPRELFFLQGIVDAT